MSDQSFTNEEFRVGVEQLDLDELLLFSKIIKLALALQDLPEQDANGSAEWLLDFGQSLIDDLFLERQNASFVIAQDSQFVFAEAA